MSDFLDQVRQIRLVPNSKVAIRDKLVTRIVEGSQHADYRYAQRYRIEMRVGTSVLLDDRADGPLAREALAKRVQHSIAQAVYGDVRRRLLGLLPMLLELRTDANWDDFAPILTEIDSLLAEIEP